MQKHIVELPAEYEEMINKLESQITDLFSEIHYYQALVTEKENTIIRLTTENRYLKAQAQKTSSELTPPPSPPQQLRAPSPPSQASYAPHTPSQQLHPPSYPSKESYTPPPSPPQQLSPPSPPSQASYTPSAPAQYEEQTITSSEDTRINKRVCPECGAMGFAIKEVDDRSRIISYTPRRIYAKKKSCTKCRYEWH